jgi:hypothetical protein
MLFQSEVWKHFITSSDEKHWKAGKRKAEKDPLAIVGGSFFNAIRRPEGALHTANV